MSAIRRASAAFRSRRNQGLRALIASARGDRGGPFRILDLGGTPQYWHRVGLDWIEANDLRITVCNHAEGEFRPPAAEPRITCIVGDATDMAGHADGSFDLVHSNSVIEHVGGWAAMRRFAGEVRRLAPAYYIQTPYFWFPFDPHFYRVPFIHWLPSSWRLKILRRVRAGWAPAQTDVDQAMRLVESNVMLDRLQFRALFPDAVHSFERVALLPKSMIAARRTLP